MIRRFKNSDLAAVMEIWLAGNLQAHSFIDENYWKDNYDAVREMILQAEVYVYEEKGEIVGFLGLEEMFIAGIFVRNDKRSLGIGKALLNFLKKDFLELRLTVYQKNNRALAFYLREGFEIIEKRNDADTGEVELCLQWFR